MSKCRTLNKPLNRKPAKAVKPAKKNRYNWPPPVAPEDIYIPKQRNPIHSILTALPVIMLVVGLYFYYQAESDQTTGAPIRAQSIQIQGVFTGLSVVKSGSQGQHFLWLEEHGKPRGVRVQPAQSAALEALTRGMPLMVNAAPTVPGSGTLWAWYVEQSGRVLLNAESTLQ